MESATVVLYPAPGRGHLVSMVELGKLIHNYHPLLSLVIIITPPPFETGPTDKYIKTVSATIPSITFHHLPTIAIPPDFSSDIIRLNFGIHELYNPIFHNTLVAITEKSTIKAVILDFFTNAAFQVSKSLELPTYYFYTGGASGLCSFLHLPTINTITSGSIKDHQNVYFDVPGVPPIHSSHFPAGFVDKNRPAYKDFINTARTMAKSAGIIANTFVGFEERAVGALRDGKCIPDGPTPPTYFIGPLIAGDNQVDARENECLKWLNSQPSKSVVFLCFGSVGVFKKRQLKEMAIGLEKSKQRFLWVVRDPPPDNESELDSGGKELDLAEILPEGFLARTGDRGLVVRNWAPQTAILSHDSVGGFVSHCGWNSVLETVVAGVPMVAWPLYAEQKMNRVYLVEEMKVAVAVNMAPDGFVTAMAVEEKLKELMEGEEGKVVKERILEMSGRAKAATEDGGSSRVEFSKFTESWTSIN
ncbi:hypothetical protein L2E82_31647 [Cichorium intybus]|uniref:Uncharacterized protein n=1 Tax=Cichorium intybus TaxID=13427 RepID=A0ACB9BFU3_CICIN|nr:hypothetical protein L2E82_31647 [Cichorium intybus]